MALLDPVSGQNAGAETADPTSWPSPWPSPWPPTEWFPTTTPIPWFGPPLHARPVGAEWWAWVSQDFAGCDGGEACIQSLPDDAGSFDFLKRCSPLRYSSRSWQSGVVVSQPSSQPAGDPMTRLNDPLNVRLDTVSRIHSPLDLRNLEFCSL